MTTSQELKCCMFGRFGGYHASLIAKRVYGGTQHANYIPTPEEIQSVYRVLRKHEIKLRDWRNGVSRESKTFANSLSRIGTDSKPKLRVVA